MQVDAKDLRAKKNLPPTRTCLTQAGPSASKTFYHPTDKENPGGANLKLDLSLSESDRLRSLLKISPEETPLRIGHGAFRARLGRRGRTTILNLSPGPP